MNFHILLRYEQVVMHIFLVMMLLIAFTSCSENPDSKLASIAGFVSNDPERALDSLENINPDNLSVSDRHFYDFLTIKAQDKSFIKPESDSIILNVIKYYSADPSDPIYPEALYYGGRVYSDLGDYPTALRYFQQALENPGCAPDTTDLKNRLNSQTGALLQKLRLYKEAIPYYEQLLNLKMSANDSAGIVYGQQGLGSLYYDLGSVENDDSIKNGYLRLSDSILNRSLDYVSALPESFEIETRILLSGVKQSKGDIKGALNMIRHIPEKADSIQRNAALAYAADIYLDAGVVDSAYMYAHDLITSSDLLNKKTGYQIILAPEFRNTLHPDTLYKYYCDYKDILEEYFDENTNQLSLIQTGQYNYQLHERESMEAHEESELKTWIIVGFAFLAIVLAFVILYLKYRNRDNIIKLREALDTLRILKQEIKLTSTKEGRLCQNNERSVATTSMSEKMLREELRRELMEMYEQTESFETPQVIIDSKVYSELKELLANNKPINNDEIWEELEKTVQKVSPRFISDLKVLTGNKLSSLDLHTALLIKCGFRPSELVILLARTNGAIISRRSVLGGKILDEKLNVKVIDGIIRLI